MRSFTRLSVLLAVLLVMILSGSSLMRGQAARAAQATQAATYGPVVGGQGAAATAAAPQGAGPTMTSTPLPSLKAELMGLQAYGNLQEGFWHDITDRAGFMGFK